LLTDIQFQNLFRNIVSEWMDTEEYRALSEPQKVMVSWLRSNATVQDGELSAKATEIERVLALGNTQFDPTNFSEFVNGRAEKILKKLAF